MGPILLLPPSEGKRPGGRRGWRTASGTFGGLLGEHRSAVAEALRTAMADEERAGKLTGVAGDRHHGAVAANRSVVGAAMLPAWRRYTGVVWEHLGPESLSTEARARAEGIVVVSALGGLFGWSDPVPDYKLKMGANLAPLGVLSRFWLPALGRALARRARGRTVVDLLPDEHRRALPEDLAAVRVEFRTSVGRAAGHGAKAAKGLFVRHLLEHGGTVEAAVASLSLPGWNARMVDEHSIVVDSI